MSLTVLQNDANTHACTQASTSTFTVCITHILCSLMSVWFDIRVFSLYHCCDQLPLKSECYREIYFDWPWLFSDFVSRRLRLRLSLWWEPLSGRVLAMLRETKGVEDCGLLVPGWGAHGSRGRGALGASWASLFGLPPVWQRHHEPRWRQLEAWGRPCLPPGSGGCPVTSWQPKTATSQCHRSIWGLFLIIGADVIFGQQRGGAGRRLRGEKVKTDSLSVSSFSLNSTMARECGSPGRRLSSERRESMVANMRSYLRIPPRAEVSND